MVDLGQQQRVEAIALGLDSVPDRRRRLWYSIWLAAFLIGPGVVALAVMGWLKTP